MWSRAFAALAIVLLLGGCASLATRHTFTHEAELLAKRGQPTRVWDNADGTRTLEYATQPNGETCWMYTIGAEGVVVDQFDALERDNLSRVKNDMTPEEVQRLLGQHRTVQRFVHSGEEVWDWNVRNEWQGVAATRFNVHFIDGKVVRTSYSYVYPYDGSAFGFGLGIGSHPYWGIGWGWRHPWGWPHYW